MVAPAVCSTPVTNLYLYAASLVLIHNLHSSMSIRYATRTHVVVVEDQAGEKSIRRLQGGGDSRRVFCDISVRKNNQLKLGTHLTQLIGLGAHGRGGTR